MNEDFLTQNTEFNIVLDCIVRETVNDFFPNGNTPLIESIIFQSKLLTKMLLENGADVNCRSKDGFHPLIIACSDGNYDIIKILLEAGADVNVKNKNGLTPFMILLKFNRLKFVELILKYKPDFDAFCNQGNNALLYAVNSGNVGMVTYLIASGANIKIRNIYGRSPFWIASLNGDIKIMSLLLSIGANINDQDNDGITPIINAIRNQDIKAFNFLRIKAGNLLLACNKGIAPSDYALLSGNAEIIVFFTRIFPHWNMSQRFRMPILFFLIENTVGKVEAVKTIITFSKNVNYFVFIQNISISPLMLAIQKRDYSVTEVLLNNTADPNFYDSISPLQLALQIANEGDFRFFDLLREKGAKLESL